MPTILVVDDSAYARRVHRRLLEDAGHSVLEASSGMTAIECFFLHRPDVVLLDLTMEDVDGYDVLRRLREIDPDVRVIVISADIQRSTERLVAEAGAKRFLGKPVDLKALSSALESVLNEVPQ